MHILVTGAAGFIGYHVCARLIKEGHSVLGIDNINEYYSPALKNARLDQLQGKSLFQFRKLDLVDDEAMQQLFVDEQFTHVIHLAAQAGVRYSLENPRAYVHSNVNGFLHILEGCRQHQVQHLVYASSSSVYGLNTQMPFSTKHATNHPVSLYAATKKSNELMAHAYSHLYNLPTTGLRFFTVYGPWGRPDMALFIFTQAILQGKPIPVFNHGNMQRDFTYIDDIVEGVVNILKQPAIADASWDSFFPDPSSSNVPYKLYNIGNNHSVSLMDFIKTLENALGRQAQINFLPMQNGDVTGTYADIEPLRQAVGFSPETSLSIGIAQFVAWYREFYL